MSRQCWEKEIDRKECVIIKRHWQKAADNLQKEIDRTKPKVELQHCRKCGKKFFDSDIECRDCGHVIDFNTLNQSHNHDKKM